MSAPSKPAQTVDQSMKYMAWDIKQIAKHLETLPEISRHLAALNHKLEGITKGSSTTPKDTGFPF